MKSVLVSGKLIKWKDEKGFGFIRPTDGSVEVFLHISEIKDSTRRPVLDTQFTTILLLKMVKFVLSMLLFWAQEIGI